MIFAGPNDSMNQICPPIPRHPNGSVNDMFFISKYNI